MTTRKFSLKFVGTPLLFLSALAACAGQDQVLKPRDLFYERESSSVTPAGERARDKPGVSGTRTDVATEGQRNRTSGRLAVRYQVLLDEGNRFIAVDAARTVFRDGDGIRLTLQANAACYLYILQKGASGSWTRLFPQPWMAADSNHLTAYDAADFPASPGFLKFNNEAGTEEVYVVFSPTKDVPVNKLIDASTITEGAPETRPASPTIMARRDLVFEQVEEEQAGVRGPATYVSFREGSIAGPVILKIRLRHEPRTKQ